MNESIVGALILTALTGLTIVAYRHPTAYAKLYPPLVGIFFFSWLLYMTFDSGYLSGFGDAKIQIMKLNPNELLKTPQWKSNSPWVYFIMPAFVLYLTFLRTFPLLGIVSKKQEEDHP
jgi:hypothetical protein